MTYDTKGRHNLPVMSFSMLLASTFLLVGTTY